jgi:hypothetical protein
MFHPLQMSMKAEVSSCCSEHVSVSWLRKLLVRDHLVLDSDQDLLQAVSGVPALEHMELGWFHGSVVLVNARKVDLGVELDGWWLGWIVLTALDRHHVNSIVKVGVWWSNDGSIPLSERFIITYNNLKLTI